MDWSFGELLAFLSRGTDLRPGDVIGSGTVPGGCLLEHVDTGHCSIAGPYTIAQAKLGPLQDNGGENATHALLAGSAAIDTGATCPDKIGAALSADQRGVARPQGVACDIGAFELADLVFADDFDPGT